MNPLAIILLMIFLAIAAYRGTTFFLNVMVRREEEQSRIRRIQRMMQRSADDLEDEIELVEFDLAVADSREARVLRNVLDCLNTAYVMRLIDDDEMFCR